jgi:cyclase
MKLRAVLLAMFAGLAGLALFVARSEAQPETIRQIVPGIWFREGDLQKLGHSNNVVIEMREYLIVVDANFPSGARAVLADVKRVSSKPVRYVFDTHHHGDHAYGNAVFTENGAVTLAHAGVAEEMKRLEPKRWQDAANSRKDVAELKRDTAEPPKQTFSGDLYVLEDASRRVEFRHFGWAHTRGDGFAYLPAEQIICTGDAVVNGPYNYMGDGNIGNWPKVVRAAATKLKVKHVLPGHGLPGGPEIFTGQERFLTELYKAVKAAIDQGRKPEELESVVKLPDNVKHWVGSFYKTQLRDVYEEIRQGKPRGALPPSS